MNALEKLAACTGNWQGNNRLHDPNTGNPEDTLSTLTVMRTNDALHCDYTWAYQGKPQQGTLSLREKTPGQVTATWKDTWHTEGDMVLNGENAVTGPLSLRGSYPAPPGPDWGWRIVLECGETVQIRMYNIFPEGQEEIAVEAAYTRSTPPV